MRDEVTAPGVSGSPAPGLATPLDQLARLLRREGLHAALRFLNGRTRHRYTAVYRFDPPTLRCLGLFDRENPAVDSARDQLISDSYCAFVASLGEPFTINDSLSDRRVDGHPRQQYVLAYHGYPLRDASGSCFGTLCHWDVRPRLTPASEVELLAGAAELLARVVAPTSRS